MHYRYVEVDENQICCVDDTQDRVNVGIGDMCCGSVPYSSNGAQICCDSKRALMPEKETSLSSYLLTSYAVYYLTIVDSFLILYFSNVQGSCTMVTRCSAVEKKW